MTLAEISSPHRTGLRSDRWQPTRAGILNVWRYYEETFEFHHGRLLLRGPNGSGKSKALEVLLPYLFDASLRAERLSTFRGTERTMHWNLMGDRYPHASRVGYVWIEFGRTDAGGQAQWFTCGARLQASTGARSVSPTYFTTTLRVGTQGGLSLVKEGNVPLTASELSAALAGSGGVLDVPGYRRTVRETLFAGFGPEQYAALIGALLQLRTPKLSEHLDPDSLSELLTRALPPLDQQDIGEIAEGFEKLDRRKEDLARLDQEVAAGERLAERQRTYARSVMRASAAELISSTTRLDNVTREARVAQTRHDEEAARLGSVTAEIGRLEEERVALEERITGLHQSDAYRHGMELDRLREEARRADDDLERAGEVARRCDEEARGDARELEGARALVERATAATDRTATAAAALGVQVGLEVVTERVRASGVSEARGLLRAGVDTREHQVFEVRQAVSRHERAESRRADAEGRLARQEALLDEAQDQFARREHERDAERDALGVEVERWARESPVSGLADRSSELAGLVDEERLLIEVVQAAAAGARELIRGEETRLGVERDALVTERGGRQAERDQLLARGVVEPGPPPHRTIDRSRLVGAPLWKLLDWRSGVSDERQAGIEAALEAAGLLDAWVSADGRVQVEGHDTYVDAALATPAPHRSLADVLMVDPAGLVPHPNVEAVLLGIALGDRAPDHVAAVGEDGSWRLATAHGSWAKPVARYLGASARERERRRRLAELDAEIARLDVVIAEVDRRFAALARRRDDLARELERRPKHDALRLAAARVTEAASRVAGLSDLVHAAREELERANAEVSRAYRDLALIASKHRLPSGAGPLEQLGERLRAYREAAGRWLDERMALERAKETLAAAERHAERSARQARDAAFEVTQREHLADRLRVRLVAVEGSIGMEYRRVLDEVAEKRAESRAVSNRQKRLTDDQSRANRTIGDLQATLRMVAERREQAAAERDRAAERFRRLAGLSIGRDAGLAADLSDLPNTTAARLAASAVAEELALASVRFEPADIQRAGSRLTEAMYEVRQALAGRADLELETDSECEALVATATIDGLAVSPGELSGRLVAERDTARAQLSEDERKLFDQTLAGDTRRHVAERIRQADALVRGMNADLDRVQTASGMRLGLRWGVDPNQEVGMREARALLLREPATLGEGERDALHQFFRARIDEVRDAGTASGWEEQLMRVLDYREWHRFEVLVRRPGGDARIVTRREHGTMSGGEKAIVLHLPLFAAVAAHYGAAPSAPRLILLDEVFVGVDQTNRGQLLDLATRLDLDMVLTSDHEWCTYAELDGIAIHQIVADGDGDDAVTTARFVWDGDGLRPAEPGEG